MLKKPNEAASEATFGSFRARSHFIDAEAIAFRQRLVAAAGNRGFVSCKARAIDVIDVDRASQNISQSVRLNLKTIPFLVCDAASGKPVLTVQTFATHSSLTVRGDKFLRSALEAAGIPLLEVDLKDLPTVERLTAILTPLFPRDQSPSGQLSSRTVTEVARSSPPPPKREARQDGSAKSRNG